MKNFSVALIALISLTCSLLFSTVTFAAGTEGMNTLTDNLNVRSAASIANNVIGLLAAGQQVKVIKVVGDWCQIEYKDAKEAYVFCTYLKPTISPQPLQDTSIQNSFAQTTTNSVTCDSAPIQAFGGITAAQGEMKVIKVPVCAGWRYLACTQNPKGNPDLYGGAIPPTTSISGEKSTDTTMDDGSGNQIPRPDCISFSPQIDGFHYVGVYGATADSKANIWVSSSKKNNVPEGFKKQLAWFSDSCSKLTTKKYGPFNTAWGNDGNADRPFYETYANYIHGGVDIACPANTPVKAMCDGTIVDSNDAGEGWGWHTVLECKKADTTISIAYIHLNQDSVLDIGTKVTKGQVIGTVFPMKVPGEVEHLHLTGCDKSNADCQAAGFQPARGAARRGEWWGVSQYWFDMDWRSSPDLYESLPRLNP